MRLPSPVFLPERLAAAARAGLDELWLWEDCFLTGGLSTAAIALSHSASLTVGIGVLPVPMSKCRNLRASFVGQRRAHAVVNRITRPSLQLARPLIAAESSWRTS